MNVWLCKECGTANEYGGGYISDSECICCGAKISAVEREKIENNRFLNELANDGSTGALFDLYLKHENAGDFDKAFDNLKKGAELNDSRALLSLATIYTHISGEAEYYGIDVDYKSGVQCLKRAYELSDPGCTFYYLSFLNEGHGVSKDEKLSIKEMIKGADSGIPECQGYMAIAYDEGSHGVKKNDKKAVYWSRRYLKSLEFFPNSNSEFEETVKYILGKHYCTGTYVPKNLDSAKELLEYSYGCGNEVAGLYLCEFVYPFFSATLNLKAKRIAILNELKQSDFLEIADHARYLLDEQ